MIVIVIKEELSVTHVKEMSLYFCVINSQANVFATMMELRVKNVINVKKNTGKIFQKDCVIKVLTLY